MPGSVINYSLGIKGVNVDKSPIHLDDAELTLAQNAIREPLGEDGGIVKRPGLTPINATPITGAVLGGVGVPIALSVSIISGVPVIDVTPDTGTVPGGVVPSGTPSGPGGTPGTGGTGLPGNVTSGSGGVNGVAGTGTGTATRYFYWARRGSSDGTSGTRGRNWGWYRATDGFVTPCGTVGSVMQADGTAVNNIGPRSKNLQVDATYYTAGDNFMTSTNSYLDGAPGSAVVYNNIMFFSPDSLGTTGGAGGFAQARIFGMGLNNFGLRQMVTVPQDVINNGNGSTATHNECVLSMIVANNTLYFTTGYGVNGTQGRVFAFDANSLTLTQLGPAFAAKHTPYSLAFHNGKLWVGTFNRSADAAPGVYFYNLLPPATSTPFGAVKNALDDVWHLDHTMNNGTAVTTMASYNGVLYASTLHAAGQPTQIEARDALGNWTNSMNIVDDGDAYWMFGLIGFNGNLYVHRFSETGGATTGVYQFDNVSTWTLVKSTAVLVALNFSWMDQGVLYFGGGGNLNAGKLFSTPDGSVWTDRTANLTNSDITSAIMGGTIVDTVFCGACAGGVLTTS